MATFDRPEVSLKLLLIALGVGVLAAFLAVWYLNAKEAQLRRELTPVVEMRDVVVANQPLLKGTVLSTANLSVRSVPTQYLNRESLSPNDFDVIEGKVLIQNVDKGNVILASYVALGFPKDFSDTIPLKRRAMTIQVDELNSINGFIRPGNRIDLFANILGNELDSEGLPSGGVIPILENVEVLATGQSAAREYEEQVRLLRGGYNTEINTAYTTITLNVTAREAAILVTAKEKGDLLALLRNREDQSGSQFTNLTSADLIANAQKLAQDAQIREAAAAAAGFVVDKDGIIRTKDGITLKNQDLIVLEDGTIMTKDGIIISGRGLTVNEKGELVDADGNVVDPNTLTVAADGSVITADGRILGGEKALSLGGGGLAVVRNSDGTSSLRSADGTVITGLKINENGKVVLADGTEVDPSDLIIMSDGRIMTKDGRLVKGGTIGKLAGKLTMNADGTITTASGAVITGATLNEKGQLVLADGTVIDPDDLIINADGSISTTSGKVLKSVIADVSNVADFAQRKIYEVDYIVGGVSKDGVAEVKKVPVEKSTKGNN